MESAILKTEHLNAYFGEAHVLKDVNISIQKNTLSAIMGPSGCGKSTFIRCINRLHELTENAHYDGNIIINEEDISKNSPTLLRRTVGMVFQRPNPFNNMSIYENVVAGYILNMYKLTRAEKDEIVEESLKKAALWDEVKDNLHKKGTFLSGGQQQRLCIARSLSMKPSLLLLDEPTSALDPISTAKIEELLLSLKENYTIIIVTHNMQQAGRVSDRTAFFYLGELVEWDTTKNIFTNPKDIRTQNYVTGRFG
ncbi:MAG: phosphate ABC transporter ATP-binding protein PstB [Bacteroidales bacterium]|jgi:phosphate transport system ATP-binding protein